MGPEYKSAQRIRQRNYVNICFTKYYSKLIITAMHIRARKRVFDFLTEHTGASAGQIGRGLGMSTPAVRHHLSILEAEGRIEPAPSTRSALRGRPELRYRVAERLQGDNLALISDTLLKTWKSTSTTHGRRRLIDALAQGLAEQLGPTNDNSTAAIRIAALVESLNQLHYLAHWEAGAEGPRIIFGHCPYAAVIEGNPELCQMDARAVSLTMRAEAQQIAKIDLKSNSGLRCVFSLK
jgi:predicted ArsR family transcriptional regulator